MSTTYIDINGTVIESEEDFDFESTSCFEELSKYAYDLYKHREDLNEVNIDSVKYLPGNIQKVTISVTFKI